MLRGLHALFRSGVVVVLLLLSHTGQIEDEEWVHLSAEAQREAKEGAHGTSSVVDTVFRDVSSLQPSFWVRRFFFFFCALRS
jgi:hypothetical protein